MYGGGIANGGGVNGGVMVNDGGLCSYRLLKLAKDKSYQSSAKCSSEVGRIQSVDAEQDEAAGTVCNRRECNAFLFRASLQTKKVRHT